MLALMGMAMHAGALLLHPSPLQPAQPLSASWRAAAIQMTGGFGADGIGAEPGAEPPQPDVSPESNAQEPLNKPSAETEAQPLSEKAAKKAEKEALRAQIELMEKTLTQKRGELAQARDDARDAGEAGYMLLAANFERARLASRTELQGQAGYGKMEGMRPLIPFIEEFAALQAESTGSDSGSDSVHSYYSGIHKQVLQLVEAERVAPFQVFVGDRYDWKRHKEVERRQSAEVEKGCILEVLSQGYMMGADVLREAEVVVSAGVVEPEPMPEPVPGPEGTEGESWTEAPEDGTQAQE